MSPARPEHADVAADAAAILRRAALAEAASAERLEAAITDVLLPDEARLDDETRWLVGERLSATIEAIERDLTAAAGGSGESNVFSRLRRSGLLRDPLVMGEVIAEVRLGLLAEALRGTVAPMDRSDLVTRLLACPDDAVAESARAFVAAENQSRGAAELSASAFERLVWWVAAAVGGSGEADPVLDIALADAAAQTIAAHASAPKVSDAAERLAAAIDPRPAELADLLVGALTDARPALFVTALARISALPWSEAREVVLDPQGDRLWLALRGQGLARRDIARIGWLMCEADRRRDVETFADRLDAVTAVEPEAAAAALASARLHPQYRAALRALARPV